MKRNSPEKKVLLQWLARVLVTHSPPGEEGEMEALLLDEFRTLCDETHLDDADNVVGLMRGRKRAGALRVMAHKDEIALVVKRIESGGLIRVDMLGAFYPWKMGETPVDILTRKGIVKGVLSVGSLHISEETPRIRDLQSAKPLLLRDVYVNTSLSREELEKRGVYPGTRIVVAREMKKPIVVNHCICGYNFDDKGAVAIMLMAMRNLRRRKARLARDVYFVATSMEEVGCMGGNFAAKNLPGSTTLAIEVGPIAEEYDAKLNEHPIVWYGPGGHYHKKSADRVLDLSKKLGTDAQAVYYWGAGTDAGWSKLYGLTGKAVCIGFPCDNTHGYEMAHIQGMLNTVELITETLARGLL